MSWMAAPATQRRVIRVDMMSGMGWILGGWPRPATDQHGAAVASAQVVQFQCSCVMHARGNELVDEGPRQ